MHNFLVFPDMTSPVKNLDDFCKETPIEMKLPTDGNLQAYDLYGHTIFSFRSIGQPSFDAGQRGRRRGAHGSSFGPKMARRSIGIYDLQ